MTVAALLGHDRIPQDPHGLPLHGLAVDRGDLDPVRGDDGHVVVLEDDHVPRVREDGWNVRGHEHLTAPETDHHAPGPMLGRHQPIRGGRGDHPDGVRAPHLGQRVLHRRLEPTGGLQMVLDQVGEHLGVGLRAELVPLAEEALLDLQVVLENPVVNHDQLARAVGVGMGVFLGGPAVRGPPRVADPERAGDGPLAQNPFEQLDAPGRAPDVQLAAVQDGHARGVVAAVLQALQPLDDDLDGTLVTHVPDDPAHGLALALRLAAAGRAAWPSPP